MTKPDNLTIEMALLAESTTRRRKNRVQAPVSASESESESEPKGKRNKTKRKDAKYKDLPVGLTESRGCRGEFLTKKGNPIGRIMCHLRSGKFFSRVYGDRRTRKQAISAVLWTKEKDRKKTD